MHQSFSIVDKPLFNQFAKPFVRDLAKGSWPFHQQCALNTVRIYGTSIALKIVDHGLGVSNRSMLHFFGRRLSARGESIFLRVMAMRERLLFVPSLRVATMLP